MARYVVSRTLGAVPLILAVIALNFAILHLAPGDPVYIMLGNAVGVSEEYVNALRVTFGLDRPISTQLALYVKNVLRGNLGYSFYYHSPVFDIVVERLPVTYLLVILSTIAAAMTGIVLGVLSSRRPYSFVDNASNMISILGYAVPVFWLGQVLIIVFSIYLRLLPTGGIPYSDTGSSSLLDWLRYLFLPVLSLSVLQLALVSRVTRASMLEVFRTDYIRTAEAKGLSDRVVTLKHALRNAILPIVTVISVNFAFQISGAMIVETVFNWPGLGQLMFDSILRRDYPVLLGMLVLTSVTVIIVNLATDILYAYLDPRIVYT